MSFAGVNGPVDMGEHDAMEGVIYWNKETETLPREKLRELQLDKFKKQMAYVYERSPFYKKKFGNYIYF